MKKSQVYRLASIHLEPTLQAHHYHNSQSVSQVFSNINAHRWIHFLTSTAAVLGVSLVICGRAIATPVPTISAAPEADTSIIRNYSPAVVYLPDPTTQQLVPTSVLVTADEPVEGAVDQIMQSYEGQDIGIQGYEVSVDPSANAAEINFNLNNPRGARAFQSLSSANQYSMFEAIRETLLTQPTYRIDEVNFQANGVGFDI